MFQSDFVQTTLTPILAMVGALFGVIGTAIGIWNLWLASKTHRVNLKIEAIGGGESYIVKTDGKDERQAMVRNLTIKVFNNSYFPVTVTEVGFVMKHPSEGLKLFPLRFGSRDTPQQRRIDARDTASFTFTVMRNSKPGSSQIHLLLVADDYPATRFAVQVYARLSTGHVAKGGTTDLPRIIEAMKQCLPSNQV